VRRISVGQLITWLFVGGIAIVIGFVILVVSFAGGEELTRATITEDEPGALTFKMPDGRVELFAEIDLVMDDLPGDDDGDVNLPDALNYAVEVYADGEPVFAKECEAIWPRLFDWTSQTGDPDEVLSTRERVQYLGRLEGCTVFAEAGQTITISASRVWRIDEYRDYIRRTEIAAKLPGVFSGM